MSSQDCLLEFNYDSRVQHRLSLSTRSSIRLDVQMKEDCSCRVPKRELFKLLGHRVTVLLLMPIANIIYE